MNTDLTGVLRIGTIRAPSGRRALSFPLVAHEADEIVDANHVALRTALRLGILAGR